VQHEKRGVIEGRNRDDDADRLANGETDFVDSPYNCEPSNAASRIMSPERPASPRDSTSDFPFSRDMICAMSSARSSASCAARVKIAKRACAGVRRHTSKPRTAASIARVASAGRASATSPTMSPLNGDVTFSVSPARAATHSPPMRRE
jgi:hypothetical protein